MQWVYIFNVSNNCRNDRVEAFYPLLLYHPSEVPCPKACSWVWLSTLLVNDRVCSLLPFEILRIHKCFSQFFLSKLDAIFNATFIPILIEQNRYTIGRSCSIQHWCPDQQFLCCSPLSASIDFRPCWWADLGVTTVTKCMNELFIHCNSYMKRWWKRNNILKRKRYSYGIWNNSENNSLFVLI